LPFLIVVDYRDWLEDQRELKELRLIQKDKAA
jgi:hypothetical protein